MMSDVNTEHKIFPEVSNPVWIFIKTTGQRPKSARELIKKSLFTWADFTPDITMAQYGSIADVPTSYKTLFALSYKF